MAIKKVGLVAILIAVVGLFVWSNIHFYRSGEDSDRDAINQTGQALRDARATIKGFESINSRLEADIAQLRSTNNELSSRLERLQTANESAIGTNSDARRLNKEIRDILNNLQKVE